MSKAGVNRAKSSVRRYVIFSVHKMGTLFFSLVILRLGLTPACIPIAAQYRNRADANGGEQTGACRDLASLGTRGVFRLRSNLVHEMEPYDALPRKQLMVKRYSLS